MVGVSPLFSQKKFTDKRTGNLVLLRVVRDNRTTKQVVSVSVNGRFVAQIETDALEMHELFKE